MQQFNRIYGGVEAETRKSQISFQIISLMQGLPNNLKTSLGFPCRCLNPTIDYFSHPLYL